MYGPQDIINADVICEEFVCVCVCMCAYTWIRERDTKKFEEKEIESEPICLEENTN